MTLRSERSVKDGAISVSCPGPRIPVNISIEVARWWFCPCVQNGSITPIVSSVCDWYNLQAFGAALPAHPSSPPHTSRCTLVAPAGLALRAGTAAAILVQASGPSAACGFSIP